MPRAHIGGEGGRQFQNLVGPVDPRRVLLIGVDVSKPSWFVLGSDLTGEIVLNGAKLMADAAGLEHLLVLVHETSAVCRRSCRRWDRSDGPPPPDPCRAPVRCRESRGLAGQSRRRHRGPQGPAEPPSQDRLAGRHRNLRAAAPRRGQSIASGPVRGHRPCGCCGQDARTWSTRVVVCATRRTP